jgi:L-glyceraldehyde 3-phosphate reductase
MDALDLIVRQGKALYTGLSNHGAMDIRAKHAHAVAYHTARPIISQSAYSMLNREVERGVLDASAECGMGVIAYVPLAQGALTDKYLRENKPKDSRLDRSIDTCAKPLGDRSRIEGISKLNDVARRRGQTLAQMAIAWILRRPEVTSVLIGASRPEQIDENVAALKNLRFSSDELDEIDAVLHQVTALPEKTRSE